MTHFTDVSHFMRRNGCKYENKNKKSMQSHNTKAFRVRHEQEKTKIINDVSFKVTSIENFLLGWRFWLLSWRGGD